MSAADPPPPPPPDDVDASSAVPSTAGSTAPPPLPASDTPVEGASDHGPAPGAKKKRRRKPKKKAGAVGAVDAGEHASRWARLTTSADSLKGRCVVATKDIPAGTDALLEVPHAFVVAADHARDVCAICLTAGPLLGCDKCQRVYYCTRVCQEMHAALHSHTCAAHRAIRATKADADPTLLDLVAVAAVQHVLNTRGGAVAGSGGAVSASDAAGESDQVGANVVGASMTSLITHRAEVAPAWLEAVSSALDTIVLPNLEATMTAAGSGASTDGAAAGAGDARPAIDLDMLIDIACRINANSHGIPWLLPSQTHVTVVGVALNAAVGMMNHSCAPNCYAGGRVINVTGDAAIGEVPARRLVTAVRTLREVKAGEELCIPYVDLVQDTDTRRRELQRTKHFLCDCDRCAARLDAEQNMAERQLGAVCCRACGGDGGLLVDSRGGGGSGGNSRRRRRKKGGRGSGGGGGGGAPGAGADASSDGAASAAAGHAEAAASTDALRPWVCGSCGASASADTVDTFLTSVDTMAMSASAALDAGDSSGAIAHIQRCISACVVAGAPAASADAPEHIADVVGAKAAASSSGLAGAGFGSVGSGGLGTDIMLGGLVPSAAPVSAADAPALSSSPSPAGELFARDLALHMGNARVGDIAITFVRAAVRSGDLMRAVRAIRWVINFTTRVSVPNTPELARWHETLGRQIRRLRSEKTLPKRTAASYKREETDAYSTAAKMYALSLGADHPAARAAAALVK